MSSIYLQLGQSIDKGKWFDIDADSDFDELRETLETQFNDGEEYEGDVLVTDSEGLAVPFTGNYGGFEWDDFIECASRPDYMEDDAVIAFIEYYGSWDTEAFADSYQGEYDSDEDFAQQMADDIGATDDKATWPYTCIDWVYAAKELMYDYYESNGHYFRSV